MLSESTLSDLRASLEQERSDLRARLSEMGLLSGGESFDQNFADSSQVTAERGEVEALAGSLRESLNDVEAALAKLDSGNYGTCEACGQPIAPARLEAKPAARLCMDCASRR
ncbi:MAG TPA: TraR/DksA C4-type zinc finger protein [Acidimicrobiales bacterium]|nr:TraR/DksA C4-type zinc finger protein [Acidimicrobiales bacterium]